MTDAYVAVDVPYIGSFENFKYPEISGERIVSIGTSILKSFLHTDLLFNVSSISQTNYTKFQD